MFENIVFSYVKNKLPDVSTLVESFSKVKEKDSARVETSGHFFARYHRPSWLVSCLQQLIFKYFLKVIPSGTPHLKAVDTIGNYSK